MSTASGQGLLFLKKFMKHGTRVASITPSSMALASETCRMVDGSRPQTIVELGAGTGAITRAALKRMHPESRLIAFEIDPVFASILIEKCPKAEVVCGDAAEMVDHLRDRGVESFDLLLSGLPTPSLPPQVTESILSGLQEMAPEAYFSQLTVMPWVYKSKYERLFEEVRFELVVRNLPPGGAYHCRRLKPDFARRLRRR
jgi:phospholipid N-methyltransferase